MLKSKNFLQAHRISRCFVSTVNVKKADNVPDVFTETSGDGVKLTCITAPAFSTGLSRVVAVFKSGSRHEEKSTDRGLSHLVRRSFGLSTDQYTAFNLTHHLEQMAARVKCVRLYVFIFYRVAGTREHTIYSVDVAPNLASRAGYLLAHMATATSYYNWELKDISYKLMKNDIDLINRREMPEHLLHEASFGNHADGTRLGRSLYSSHERLGSYSYDQITNFLKKSVMPGKCAITLMNLGNGHQHMDLKKVFDEIKSGLKFHPPEKDSLSYTHDFVGNEIRRDIATSSSTHAMVAYHVPGGRKNLTSHIALAVASQALHGGIHNISYADASSRTSRLAKSVENTGFDDFLTQCGSLYHSYSDHGLFGFSVIGSCGRATGARVVAASKAIAEVGKSGLTLEEIQRGNQLAIKSENMQEEAVDISLQVLETGSFRTFDQLTSEIDMVTPENVNQTLKQVIGSNKMAMSVVGANTALTPPLCLLKN